MVLLQILLKLSDFVTFRFRGKLTATCERKLTYGLYDHGVDLVGAELEFVAGEAVCETEGESRHLLLGQPVYQAV